ncbi:hypothetical protein [Paramixta manurensis]|uniref:hypothetical protein n=1 Tax=Paramixta manurensis TaxID=2740817 RepID=UPI00156A8DEE
MINIIIWFVGASVLAIVLAISFSLWTGSVYNDFKKNGIKTEAEIIDIKQVATSSAGSPDCVFTLAFSTESHERIQVKKKQVVLTLSLAKLERERKVDIFYKPDDPNKIWMILGGEESDN